VGDRARSARLARLEISARFVLRGLRARINPATATRGEEIDPEAGAEIAVEALPLYEEVEALLRKP
jgi:hypothetical protein